MIDVNALLAQVTQLKNAAVEYSAQLQDAKTREALIDAQVAVLTEALQEAAGTIDWSHVGELVIRAAEEAEGALQALAAALNEAGVEYE